ncbi:MAG: hypothetical protein GY925_22005 [Actinomycetia bacterium]|nr:hypothetical protein [Actinomycetes bacterium]
MTQPSNLDAPSRWLDGLPEREMYDIYGDTLGKRFRAFQVREFEQSRFDMGQTLHQHDPSRSVDQALVDVILTRESHERLQNDFDVYASKHGLRGWVDAGESLLVVTDHGQFTDVPVVAETIGRMGFGDRHTTVQVVSEMISLMDLNIGTGPYPIIKTLSHISAVVQTVPRLDGSPSEELGEYRRRKNSAGLQVLDAVRDTEGSITVMSLVARHNVASKNGNTLYIHEPNRRTLEGYVTPNVKVIPMCIDCPTFGDDGSVTPADLRFEIFDPIRIKDSRTDTRAIVEHFRDATSRLVGDRYENGIKVRSWRSQTTAQRVRSVLPADPETTDVDY